VAPRATRIISFARNLIPIAPMRISRANLSGSCADREA
jgi:hypothetical protein